MRAGSRLKAGWKAPTLAPTHQLKLVASNEQKAGLKPACRSAHRSVRIPAHKMGLGSIAIWD
jgi:hypothetical protein